MQHAAALYILPLLLITFSCDSSQKEVDNKNTDSTKKTVMVDDTLPEVQTPPPAPSPGTARVRAKILAIQSSPGEDETFVIEIKSLQVLGYGSSTPTISVNDTLMLNASDLPANIKVDKEFVMVVHHQQMVFGDVSASQWRIVSIETN